MAPSLSMLMLCRSHKRSHINYVASNDRSWYWQPHACHKPHWTPDSIVRYSAQCLPDYSNYKPNIFLPPSSSCHNWNANHKEILPGWGSRQMLCKVCELWDRRLWRVGPVWCVPSVVATIVFVLVCHHYTLKQKSLYAVGTRRSNRNCKHPCKCM